MKNRNKLEKFLIVLFYIGVIAFLLGIVLVDIIFLWIGELFCIGAFSLYIYVKEKNI